jgi:hypothetical protein
MNTNGRELERFLGICVISEFTRLFGRVRLARLEPTSSERVDTKFKPRMDTNGRELKSDYSSVFVSIRGSL